MMKGITGQFVDARNNNWYYYFQHEVVILGKNTKTMYKLNKLGITNVLYNGLCLNTYLGHIYKNLDRRIAMVLK